LILKIWDRLYLRPTDIGELLRIVRERADTDYGYLLHAIPAYTGMGRGEVLRIRGSDVEFDRGHIIARSRKQSRKRFETTRRIDLHRELERELLAWPERRPGDPYVVCEEEDPEPLGLDPRVIDDFMGHSPRRCACDTSTCSRRSFAWRWRASRCDHRWSH